MTPRRLGLLFGLAALAVAATRVPVGAVDTKDYYERPATLAVGITGGDSSVTFSSACAIGPTATQLRPAVTDRSRRKICIQNAGSTTIAIGSSTVSASNNWVLGESTNSATSPIYCTNSSAAIYCRTLVAVISSATVRILEETQSIP